MKHTRADIFLENNVYQLPSEISAATSFSICPNIAVVCLSHEGCLGKLLMILLFVAGSIPAILRTSIRWPKVNA